MPGSDGSGLTLAVLGFLVGIGATIAIAGSRPPAGAIALAVMPGLIGAAVP